MMPKGTRYWDFMGMKNTEVENNRQRKISRVRYWKLQVFNKLWHFFYNHTFKMLEEIWIGKDKLRQIELDAEREELEAEKKAKEDEIS